MNTNKIALYELYFNRIENPSLLDILIYKACIWEVDWLVYVLESVKYGFKHKDKFIESKSLNIDVVTVDGQKNTAVALHRTKPFVSYELVMENGIALTCADDHMLYTDDNGQGMWKFVKDLHENEYLYSKYGWLRIERIKKLAMKQFMYDLELIGNDFPINV